MSEPTRGPWEAGETIGGSFGVFSRINQHEGQAIARCIVNSVIPAEEAMANARLMAASKDLLAACDAMLKLWDDFYADDGCVNPLDYPINDRMNDIAAAVARAKGGAA